MTLFEAATEAVKEVLLRSNYGQELPGQYSSNEASSCEFEAKEGGGWWAGQQPYPDGFVALWQSESDDEAI